MKIKRIKAKNVFRYKKFDLEFDDQCYLVLGKIDGSFDRSNGAGKSALIDIIYYGLYGKTLRGQNDISTDHKGDSKVLIEFDNKKIIRGRTPDGTNTLELNEDGEKITGKKKELDSFVSSKVDYSLFKLITTLTPKNNFFVLNDNDKKDILISLTKNEIIDKVQDKVKEDLDNLKTKNVDAAILTCQKYLEGADEITQNFKDIEKKMKKYLEYEDGLLKYNEYSISRIRLLDEHDKLEKKYNDLKDKGKSLSADVNNMKEVDLEKVQNEIADYKSKIETWTNKKDELNDKLFRLGNTDTCPLCGTHLKDKDKIRKNYEDDISDARQQIKIIEELLSTTREKYEELKEQKEEQDEIKLKYNETKAVFAEVKENYKNAIVAIEKLETKYKDIMKYESCPVTLQQISQTKINYGELKSKIDYIEKAKKDLKELQAQKLEIDQAITELEEIKKIFSKDGLKQYVIQKITDFLVGKINDMVVKIFENIEVKINLDFGEKRNLMNIDIIRNDEVFAIDELSTGERRIMEIIFQIALNDLFETVNNENINFMIFDEAFDALDKNNIDKINDILALLKERNKTIFVISHNAEVKKYFGHILVIEKTDGVSTIYKEGE